ncbi:MAG: hypothetical protein Pg6C_03790 [Treponemataceae bacterium]|nr:MAG: hypothetical protein Pg6C_03790 [Treponemataceae bacterium]
MDEKNYDPKAIIDSLQKRYQKTVSIQKILGASYYPYTGKDYQIVAVEYPARYEAQIFLDHELVGTYEPDKRDLDALLRYIIDDDKRFVDGLIAGAEKVIANDITA